MKKRIIIIITVALVVINILLLGVTFFPLFLLSNNEDQKSKNSNSEIATEVVSYNPFAPKMVQYIKLYDEKAYLINEITYQRSGLFSYSNPEQGKGFEVVDGKIEANNIQEAKERWKNKIQTNAKLEEFYAEDKKPKECQQLLEFPNLGTKIELFTNFFKKGDSFSIFWNKFGIKGSMYDKDNLSKFEIRIDDTNNPNIIKVVLNTESDPIDNLETKIISIEIISNNCNIAQVPTKPDGTFDFDSALAKIKK